MKAKKWIAVVLSVAVALNGIPITDITVVQAEEVVNRLNNKDEKIGKAIAFIVLIVVVIIILLIIKGMN